MPEMPNVIPGEDVDADWGNLIRSRTIQRYANEATRTSQNPSPEDGDLSYVADVEQISFFDGSGWVGLTDPSSLAIALADYVPAAGGTFTGAINFTGLAQFIPPAAGQPSIGPGAIIGSAAVSSTILRLNTDGNGDGARRFIWRRGAQFGFLELISVNNNGDENKVLEMNPTGGTLALPSTVPNTTGGPATVSIHSTSGLLQRSTSARRYKDQIQDLPPELVEAELSPVAFRHKDSGDEFIGFIADDLAALDPRLGLFNEDGDIENYDLRGVVAILAAKVNELSEQVAKLSDA